MAVSADILNGGTAGKAGDFAHGFDAGETLLASVGDGIVPVFAAHDFDAGGAVIGNFTTNTLHAIDDDNAVETGIVTDGVGPVAKYEGGELVLLGKFVSVADFLRIFDFNDIASGTAETHSG